MIKSISTCLNLNIRNLSAKNLNFLTYIKDEVFYLQSGKMLIKYSEEDDITTAKELVLNPGENFHVYRGLRHRMIALKDSELFEFSTQHFDSDSYRVEKGD